MVTRLLNANGVVLGKTRMHELAMGATTVNVYGGPVLNPYNNTMHAGGKEDVPLRNESPTLLNACLCWFWIRSATAVLRQLVFTNVLYAPVLWSKGMQLMVPFGHIRI